MSGLSDAEANSLCKPSDGSTKDFLFQQTMYRIKDPRRSLPFYSEVLGMTLLVKLDFPEAKFSLYFMGYEDPAQGKFSFVFNLFMCYRHFPTFSPN